MFSDRIRADKVRLKELEEALANSSTVHAVVGAGDLAVEKLRAALEEFSNRRSTFDAKAFRQQAETALHNGVGVLQTQAQSAPEQIRTLPERAPELSAKAQELLAVLLSSAVTTYGDLTVRGKAVIGEVRGETVAEEDVEPVSRPEPRTTTKPAVKKPAAKKPAAKKSSTTSAKADSTPSAASDSSTASDDFSS